MKEIFLDNRLLNDLETAAPKISVSGAEINSALVKALAMYASTHKPMADMAGALYWRTSLAEVISLSGVFELAPRLAGNVCRAMRCVMKREGDGYQVAWSEAQLALLKKAFDLA